MAGALTFDGTGDGGKALYALSLMAIATGTIIELNIANGGNGCNTLEFYLRS